MIGPATLGDLWTLRRKPRNLIMLYNEALLARPHRWVWYVMRSLIEGGGRDGATLVYRERGLHAVVQSLGRSGRPEQDIVLLAAYGGGQGHPSDPDIWFRLLEALCIRAGHYRIQRLFAALSQRHDELREVFRQLGFNSYVQQTVLRLEGPDWDQGTTLADMRPQTRHDIWAIHKLYGATTPRPVQHAEARDSFSWRLSRAPRRHPSTRGWVLGPKDNLTAYLRLTNGPSAHVLTVLIQPDARDITTDILRFGLAQVPNSLPVLLVLRNYQRELLLPAGDLGFQPIGEQSLLYKQTTVAARRSILLPALEPSLETRAPIPNISLGEDVRHYATAKRHHEQYRSPPGNPPTSYPLRDRGGTGA